MRQEKHQVKSKPKPKQKIETFNEYFQECIKNKSIPKDTPDYLKQALERAMKEYENGMRHEKSALENFAEKYVIDGKPIITPFVYFAEKASQIKEFLTRLIWPIFILRTYNLTEVLLGFYDSVSESLRQLYNNGTEPLLYLQGSFTQTLR